MVYPTLYRDPANTAQYSTNLPPSASGARNVTSKGSTYFANPLGYGPSYLTASQYENAKAYMAKKRGAASGSSGQSPYATASTPYSFRSGSGNMASAYQKAYSAALEANESRYQEILAGLETAGAQETKDIGTAYAGAEAAGQQDLVSRGLANTTMLPTMRTGVATAKTSALGRLKERLLQQRLGFMERRTDAYPSMDQFLQLMMGQGNYGGAYRT